MENKVNDLDLDFLGYNKTTALFEDLIKNGDEFCCDRLEETGGVFSIFRANISRDCAPRVQDFYNAGINDTKVIAYYYATLAHDDLYTIYSKNLRQDIKPLEKYSKKEDKNFEALKNLYYKQAYKQMFLRRERAKMEKEEKGL